MFMPKKPLLLLWVVTCMGACHAGEQTQIPSGQVSNKEGNGRWTHHSDRPPVTLRRPSAPQPRPHPRPPLHRPEVNYVDLDSQRHQLFSPRPLLPPAHEEDTPTHHRGRSIRMSSQVARGDDPGGFPDAEASEGGAAEGERRRSEEERGGRGGEERGGRGRGREEEGGGEEGESERGGGEEGGGGGGGDKEKGEGAEGGGRGGSKDGKAGVDNVLAALVGFSHDPTLWHFVHSVVDELDYSRRAASRSPPQRHLPASHLSDARLPEAHHSSGFWPTWGRGARDEKPREASRAASHHHHPDSGRPSPRDNDVGGNGGNDTYSGAAHHLRGGRGRASPPTAHPPTFIFHKVYINTHYDTHTRQPYHRPVLAVAAPANETTPTSSTSAATSPSTPVVEADSTRGTKAVGAGVSETEGERELPDRLETFTGVDESQTPEEPGRGAGAGVGEGTGGAGHPEEASARWRGSGRSAGSQIHPGVWREVSPKEGQRGRDTQQTLGLDTFKGQLKFLKRWEKRLWRRGLLHRSHHLLRRPHRPTEADGGKASGSSAGQRDAHEEEHVTLEGEGNPDARRL